MFFLLRRILICFEEDSTRATRNEDFSIITFYDFRGLKRTKIPAGTHEGDSLYDQFLDGALKIKFDRLYRTPPRPAHSSSRSRGKTGLIWHRTKCSGQKL